MCLYLFLHGEIDGTLWKRSNGVLLPSLLMNSVKLLESHLGFCFFFCFGCSFSTKCMIYNFNVLIMLHSLVQYIPPFFLWSKREKQTGPVQKKKKRWVETVQNHFKQPFERGKRVNSLLMSVDLTVPHAAAVDTLLIAFAVWAQSKRRPKGEVNKTSACVKLAKLWRLEENVFSCCQQRNKLYSYDKNNSSNSSSYFSRMFKLLKMFFF